MLSHQPTTHFVPNEPFGFSSTVDEHNINNLGSVVPTHSPTPIPTSYAIDALATAFLVADLGPEVEVGLHYYDLAQGMVSRYGRPLLDGVTGDSDSDDDCEPEELLSLAKGNMEEREGSEEPSHSFQQHPHPYQSDSISPMRSALRAADASHASGVHHHHHGSHIHISKSSKSVSTKGPFQASDGGPLIHRRFSVLHSAVVVYGFEYLFEGGIARAPRGCTRFGSQYRYIRLGTTRKSMAQFEQWLTEVEVIKYDLSMYRATSYNCHTFTNEAILFLTNGAVGAPSFLFRNTRRIVASSAVGMFVPIQTRLNMGTLYHVSRPIAAHTKQRTEASQRVQYCQLLTAVHAVPPRMLFLYGSSDRVEVEASIAQIVCEVDVECESYVPSVSEIQGILGTAQSIARGDEQLDPIAAATTLFVLSKLLDHRPSWQSGTLLNAHRFLLLHKTITGIAVYERRLNLILMRAAKDYTDLAPDTKIALLRVLCNYCGSAQGACWAMDGRRVDWWIGVAATALLEIDENGAGVIAELGASLLHNLSIVFITCTRGSLASEMALDEDAHPVGRIITLLLFHINSPRTANGIVLKLLLALCHLCAEGNAIAEYVSDHELVFDIDEIIAFRCSNNDAEATTSTRGGAAAATGIAASAAGSHSSSSSEEMRSVLCLLSGYLVMADAGGSPWLAMEVNSESEDITDCEGGEKEKVTRNKAAVLPQSSAPDFEGGGTVGNKSSDFLLYPWHVQQPEQDQSEESLRRNDSDFGDSVRSRGQAAYDFHVRRDDSSVLEQRLQRDPLSEEDIFESPPSHLSETIAKDTMTLASTTTLTASEPATATLNRNNSSAANFF